MYYASKNYKIVCAPHCFHVKNIKEENLVSYLTVEQAIEDGCRKCKHCLGKIDWDSSTFLAEDFNIYVSMGGNTPTGSQEIKEWRPRRIQWNRRFIK